MLSPRRGLLSPCPIGGVGGEGRISTTTEGVRGTRRKRERAGIAVGKRDGGMDE